ncbi:MAG: hypothetical protein H6696_11015 [Deferribacteres bacterium]|nr:hypothetical protein [candidate division KSB1 bacterium]MCB9502462.1 hypothetical protein [Deferribacteres bacterium]
MKKMLKDLLIYSVLFTVVVGGIWLIHGLEENSMQKAMQLMGERLVAMVAEPGEKDKIQTAFNQFMEKVFTNEVSPDQVEEVATNIINLSNKNAKLTTSQIETILSIPNLPQFTTTGINVGDSLTITIADLDSGKFTYSFVAPKSTLIGEKGGTSVREVKPEKWRAIGDRIATVFHTNDKLQRLLQKPEGPVSETMPYVVENNPEKGMQFIISNELTKGDKHTGIAKSFSKIDIPNKEDLIVWKPNFDSIMHEKKKRIADEMTILNEKLMQNKKDSLAAMSDEQTALKNLARLKELEAMAFQIKIDSLMQRVEIELHQHLKAPVPPPTQKQ